MRKRVINILNKLPYIRGLNEHYINYKKNACFPPGHFYSPIVSVEQLKKQESLIWKDKKSESLGGIDLNIDVQKELIISFVKYYKEIPFEAEKNEKLRYYFENDMFNYTDGIILFLMMRHLNPSKIIEVGSGFSSALMLDVNQKFFENNIELNFIEPNPERLYDNITKEDKLNTTIIEKKIQEVNPVFFERLTKGDILFIDSTHVSKTGSDVNFLFFEILPRLNPGVYIHFHDIFYPFEYPKEWVYGGRNWNENYLLRSFLMYNNDFKIRLFPHYLHLNHPQVFKDLPLTYKNKGGSIWLEKIK